MDAVTNSRFDLEAADAILVLGANLTECDPVLALTVIRALRKNRPVIVVDPRRTDLAGKAKYHLGAEAGYRPGRPAGDDEAHPRRQAAGRRLRGRQAPRASPASRRRWPASMWRPRPPSRASMPICCGPRPWPSPRRAPPPSSSVRPFPGTAGRRGGAGSGRSGHADGQSWQAGHRSVSGEDRGQLPGPHRHGRASRPASRRGFAGRPGSPATRAAGVPTRSSRSRSGARGPGARH